MRKVWGGRREAIQGALNTISLILGIPVLRSMMSEETARLIVYAARQVASFVNEGYHRPGYRPQNKKRRQLTFCQDSPGSDMNALSGFLKSSGSVEKVMRASRDDLLNVAGIGAKTVDRIRWAVSEKIEPYGTESDPLIWPLL